VHSKIEGLKSQHQLLILLYFTYYKKSFDKFIPVKPI